MRISNDVRYIYIPYHKDYFDYNFEEKIKERYKNIKFKFLKLINNTRGAAETIKISLDNIINNDFVDCPILCLDGDNFYDIEYDIIEKWNRKNMIFR